MTKTATNPMLRRAKARRAEEGHRRASGVDKAGGCSGLTRFAGRTTLRRRGLLQDCIVYRGRVYKAVDIEVGMLDPCERIAYEAFRRQTLCFPAGAMIVESAVSAKFVILDGDSIFYSEVA